MLGNFKGKYHENLVLYQKLQNFFVINRNLNVLLRSVMWHPSIKTIDECLWPQIDWVRMDCNLKKVWLTVFKFSGFGFQNALEQVMS